MTKKHILIVDDDPGIRDFVRNVAESLGMRVSEAKNGVDYLNRFQDITEDLLILDMLMPEETGMGLFDFLAEHKTHVPLIIITGRGQYFLNAASKMAEEKGLNLAAKLNKPISLQYLEQTLMETLGETEMPSL